jgi:DNA recombination protein RmuC
MPVEILYLWTAILTILVAVMSVLLLKRASRRSESVLLQNQINALSQQTSERMDQLRGAVEKTSAEVARALSGTQQAMGARLDTAAEVIRGVSTRLAALDESNKRIFDVGRSISELEKVLRAPKLRGNLGELFLNELLAQILPPHYCQMQYSFSGGDTVDAVIRLENGLIPVDAKFPLENFRKYSDAENDQQRSEFRKTFVRDVKKHIDAIASKYIRTDEGTLDFALMYIPAESVYYEAIIKEEAGSQASLFEYALQKRCIPVSPNSFYAYLQTIMLGLKGLRVEESAREIMDSLARLRKEMERFEEDFQLVGKHIENAAKKFQDAGRRFITVNGKLEQMEGISGTAPAALPEETLSARS